MSAQKRVAAIHDISGLGKCSLTVALPIISAAGIETAIMPTAVLSTHTGGFTGYTCRDLTSDLAAFTDHWKSLGVRFDAIYSGYLGSPEQIDIVKRFISTFRDERCTVVVDPAMADEGEMYALFDMDFAKAMTSLCAEADIILPNMTEAAFLLGREYKEKPYTREYIEELLKALSNLGPSKTVLTGVSFERGVIGASVYDRDMDEFFYAPSNRIPGYYPGAGDIFASAFVASYLSDRTLYESARIAADFVSKSVARTQKAKTDPRFGVNFEAGLCDLALELRRTTVKK
ncbi:MAG: pyridoxamine kinase [Oscillospiraceae bacterium]|nr:pyridoxamine kinase [Oscillospiraceae bacterium]